MANDLTAFKPEAWASAVIENIYPTTVGLNFVNSDYDESVSGRGATVHVRTYGTVAVGDYIPGSGITYGDITASKEALTLDKAKYFAFSVDDITRAQSDVNIINGYANVAAQKLGQVIDMAILSSYTEAHADNVVSASGSGIDISTSNIYANLTECARKLDEKGVPSYGRWMVITPYVKKVMMQADAFNKGSQLGDTVVGSARFPGSLGADVPGYIGDAAGFNVYVSNNLTASPAGTYHCPFGQGKPILFASEIPFSLVEALRDQDEFATLVRGLMVYGQMVPDALSVALGDFRVDNS